MQHYFFRGTIDEDDFLTFLDDSDTYQMGDDELAFDYDDCHFTVLINKDGGGPSFTRDDIGTEYYYMHLIEIVNQEEEAKLSGAQPEY